MLKSKKSKIIIGAVVILAVLITSSIWVTSSFKKTDVDDFDYTTLANAEGNEDSTLTQIDNIIKEEKPYRVTIITASATDDSKVTGFFDRESGFTHYVVNENRTIEETMQAGEVSVNVVDAAALSALPSKAEITTKLGDPDLMFLYGSSSASFTGSDAISEDLYEVIRNYISANKPFIISYYGLKSGESDDVGEETSSGNDSNVWAMTTQDFKNSWKRTRTTNIANWKAETATGTDATQVEGMIKAYIQSNRSTYTRYSLNDNTLPEGYASWQEYWSRADLAPENKQAALNVLYIYGDGTDWSDEKDDIQNVADWMVGEGRNYAFNTITSNIPGWDGTKGKAVVTAVQAKDLRLYDETNLAASLYVDAEYTVKRYDYIFIAPDNYSPENDISDMDVINEIEKFSEDSSTLTYIMFGTLVGKTTTKPKEDGGEVDLVIDTTTNYGKLVDLSITTTGYAKKTNILPVGVNFMNRVSDDPAKNPTKVAQIVSLINKSAFRTHAGSGGGGTSGSTSTSAFRVLELQPCYPIDLEMALASSVKTNLNNRNGYSGNGNYYTVPANVINTDEIDNFVDKETLKMTNEYYQWDLSKAKIAYALNMSVDSIELVQMSTEEFITSKADASDSYDLIYIGGNSSALQPLGSYNYWPNWGINVSTVDNTTAYCMYSHTGELAGLINKWVTSYDVTTLNGNDITYDRLQQLNSYVDSGLPVVFSNELWTGYSEAKDKGYANRYIDPDSNMYSFIEYAEENANLLQSWEIKTKGASSDPMLTKYWKSTDSQLQVVENTEGMYGTAAKVTVFKDSLSDDLYNLVYSPDVTIRPKYTITTNALEYKDSDEKTKLSERTLTWKIQLLNPIEGHTYKAALLQDKNDNAEFALKGEMLGKTVTFSGDEATLSYTYPSDDFGAFSWKVIVADVTNSTGSSITATDPSRGYAAISMFKRLEGQAKKKASILEIMPLTIDKVGGQDGQDGHTLYLDSAYQQARGSKFLYSTYIDNAFMDENGDIPDSLYNKYGCIDPKNTPSISGYAPAAKSKLSDTYWSSKDINFKENGGNYQETIYMGMYKTNLSLNRFDSDKANYHEDWTYNYVDLIKDDYDLTVDIMYMDDIEYYAKAVRNTTESERANYAEAAKDQKAIYDSYYTETSVNYNKLKKAEDHLIETLKKLEQGGSFTVTLYDGSTKTFSASDYDLYDIDGIIKSKQYYRFFYMNQSLYYGDNWMQPAAGFYFEAYLPYITEYDKVVNAYRRYRHYSMLAYGPEEYLRSNYDVIVVGFYDESIQGMVDFSLNACTDIESFIADDGSILMTHDNMTKYTTSAINLTNTLRSYAGMERFGELTVQSGTEGSAYPHYNTSDTDRYFFTNLSVKYDLSKNVADSDGEWNNKVSSWIKDRGSIGSKLGYPGYSDAFVIYETNQAQSLPYSFVEFQIQQQIKYNLAYTAYNITGTTKATQVNRGVVTTYPFFVDSDLRVSPTHNQAYSLDLENDEITVWYTFAADSLSGNGTVGGSDYQTLKENSSLYAASPKDGMDSYFIYSYGNITYCGAGHSQITGDARDNNDERKLFLNVLVNMASKSGKVPEPDDDIILYDPDGETEAPGNVVKKNGEDGYYIDVTSSIAYPEFGYSVRKKTGETITAVQVFYDLNFNGTTDADQNVYVDDDNHFEVILPSDVIERLNNDEVVVLTKEACPTLATTKDYFGAYDGTYTYIVVRVEVEDKNGVKTILSKRIKIKLSKELLDLT